jgi:lipid-A-disaccharide synthase
MPRRIVIITGEASGDQLGGGLIDALRRRYPDAVFEGLTGPRMRAAGCQSWGDYEQLAIMGLFEVIRHIPRVLRLKRHLMQRLLADPPDLLIGIDAPDFNLRLERAAREAGIPTVHYVCPSVWAWRSGRVKTLQASCDLVLCLLPFEGAFLEEHGVAAKFVGHPLADEIAVAPDQTDARVSLGLAAGDLVALLPGSRMGEVKYLGPAFMQAAVWLRQRLPDLQFAIPAASPAIRNAMQTETDAAGLGSAVTIVDGRAREVMAAADSVLLASGTATLETMLVRRPMVVAYKVFWLTAWLLRKSGLVKVDRFSLPNLLADAKLVPEILQEEATGSILGAAVLNQLQNPQVTHDMVNQFEDLAGMLRCDASEQAAAGVQELLEQR